MQQKALLFDHLVGALLEMQRYIEAQRLGRLEINYQCELCWRLHGEVGRLRAFEDAVDVLCRLTKLFGNISTIRDQAS